MNNGRVRRNIGSRKEARVYREGTTERVRRGGNSKAGVMVMTMAAVVVMSAIGGKRRVERP